MKSAQVKNEKKIYLVYNSGKLMWIKENLLICWREKKIIKKKKMNTEEFRVYGKRMVDYISEYRDTVDERNVAPTLDPGYLKQLIPCK